MRSISVVGLLWLALGAGELGGCAHEPIAQSLRQKSMKGVSIGQVQQNPGAYQGGMVIWGGHIVKVELTGGGTDIYVARTPLNSDERPESETYSEGRFIAHSKNIFEPSAYRAGRRVTVAGTLAGTQQGKIGNAPYLYPVLDIDQIVLWRRSYPYYYPGPYWGMYGWPYWGFGWGDEFGGDFGGDFGDEDEGFGEGGEGGDEGGDRDAPGR